MTISTTEAQLVLDLDLPEIEFQKIVEERWLTCDRKDLEIARDRGRLLRAIRDREKASGSKGFAAWLKDNEISKSKAYNLIKLADSADALEEEGLQPEAAEKFSQRALIETSNSSRHIQELVIDLANSGEKVTGREIKRLSDEYDTRNSELIPDEIKEALESGVLTARQLVPLVKELGKLPEEHQAVFKSDLAEAPTSETIKQATADAKKLAKYLDAVEKVQALKDIDSEKAISEAVRSGTLDTLSSVVSAAAQMEAAIAKLYFTWKKLGSLADKLYMDTGSSTPGLRKVLVKLDELVRKTMTIDIGGKLIQVTIEELN